MTFDDGGYHFAVTGNPASIKSLMRFCGENSESKRANRDMAVAKAVKFEVMDAWGRAQKEDEYSAMNSVNLAAIIAKVKP